jgi:hypothetical protein
MITRPLMACNGRLAEKEDKRVTATAGGPATNESLLQALAEIGMENPKRNHLARLDILGSHIGVLCRT